MDSNPLVSIICLCHNQKSFVIEALDSIVDQTYSNLEVILVDDGSEDGSKKVIADYLVYHPGIRYLDLPKSLGNCTAFNLAYQQSSGDFIIDLAADDLLLPHRVEIGIRDFTTTSDLKAGVHFSDAFLINRQGVILHTHYKRNTEGRLLEQVPKGSIYLDLIKRYFVNPVSMMMKKEVLEHLNGYDEQLTYEDFDFWIRSARHYHYLFNEAPLVKKRMLKNSLSAKQFELRNRHQYSTYLVCKKIADLNQSREEDQALIKRINYEIRQSLKTLNVGLILQYEKLKTEIKTRHP